MSGGNDFGRFYVDNNVVEAILHVLDNMSNVGSP